MNGPFDIQASWLGELNEAQGPEVLHSMLCAEARICGGVDLTKIETPITPRSVKTPDKGIDAAVKDAHPGLGNHGIIKNGDTYYQVKTGDTTNANTDGAAKKIIARQNNQKAWVLNPRVSECLERHGTLVIVLFGIDNPDSTNAEQHVRNAIAECDPQYKEYDKIEVWHQNHIVGMLASFPSIRIGIARITGHYSPAGLEDMAQWESRASMCNRFEATNERQHVTAEIRKSLQENPEAPVRILGQRKIGKTRTVLESLKQRGTRDLVAYAERPGPTLDELIAHFQRADTQESCIVVVDNCPRHIHAELVDKLNRNLGRVSLITIGTDTHEGTIPHTRTIALSPLSEGTIRSILCGDYKFPPNRATTLSKLCNGSPNVAHSIGNHARTFRDVDIEPHGELCEYLIMEGSGQISTEDRNRRVLMALSPFTEFGYRAELRDEGRAIIAFVAEWTGLQKPEVEEAIWDLRNRGLLAGDHLLRIEPEFLHIWLFSQWANAHGPCFSWTELCALFDLTERPYALKHRFFLMMEYATGEYVDDVASELLGPRGPYENPLFAGSEDGQMLLVNLARISPKCTLDFIERWLSEEFADAPKKTIHACGTIVEALRLIARHGTLFARSAELLLALSRAEEEPYFGNGATETLAGLFSNGVGPLSPSGASPSERFKLLDRLALSEDEHERSLALRAIDVALQFPQTRLEIYSDMDSLRATSPAWRAPNTTDEYAKCYEMVWNLGLKCLGTYEGALRERLFNILVGSMDGIVFSKAIPSEEWANWFKKLAESEGADRSAMHKHIVDMLRYQDSLDIESEKRLRLLLDSLYDGADFGERLRRLVTYDDCLPPGTSSNREGSLRELAEEAVSDPTKIATHMAWLVSTEPENAYDFGRAVELVDDKRSVWQAAVNAIEKLPRTQQGEEFIGGYLHEACNQGEEEWTNLVSTLCERPTICGVVPQLVCRSGAPGAQGMRIIVCLIQQDKIDANDLLPLSGGIKCIWSGMDNFKELVDLLLNMDDPTSKAVALRMVHTMLSEKALPEDLVLRVLIEYRPEFGICEFDYTLWCNVAKAVSVGPQNVYRCTNWVIENYRRAGLRHAGNTFKALTAFVKSSSEGFWSAVQEKLEKADHRVVIVFDAEHAVSGAAPIEHIPHDQVLDWAREDIDNRPSQLAALLDPNQLEEHHSTSLIKTFCAEFGHLPELDAEPPAAY